MSDEKCRRCGGSGKIKYWFGSKSKQLIEPCPFCRAKVVTPEEAEQNKKEIQHATRCKDCHALEDRLAACRARIEAMEKEIYSILRTYGGYNGE